MPLNDDIWQRPTAATAPTWSDPSAALVAGWSDPDRATTPTFTPQRTAWPWIQAENGDWLLAEDGEAFEVEH